MMESSLSRPHFLSCGGMTGVALSSLMLLAGAANAIKARDEPSDASAMPEIIRVPAGASSLRVALHHRPPTRRQPVAKGRVVLFVHGATFPTALAAGFRFDGHSWMDDLAAAGFDVWGLDFVGYGASDRYPEMREPAGAHPPLGRADAGSRQIAVAVREILARRGVSRVSIVAHSWGTSPAGLYATREPATVDRLVLFGPITPLRTPEPGPAPRRGAYRHVTVEAQEDRFTGEVPDGEAPVLASRHFAAWGPRYLATDPTSVARMPPSVRVPSGPVADFDAAARGEFPYDPGRIIAPTLIVRGEWDTVTTDADARWLYNALRAVPIKRNVVISHGTHVTHLEESRYQLYREVQVFLEAGDLPPSPARRTP